MRFLIAIEVETNKPLFARDVGEFIVDSARCKEIDGTRPMWGEDITAVTLINATAGESTG